MVEVNWAKELLECYFRDDKDCVIECSKAGEAQDDDVKSSSSAYDGAAVDWQECPDFVCDIREIKERIAKDSPFTDCEYTSKPQYEWTEEDWEAFKHFQPPKSFDEWVVIRNYEYFNTEPRLRRGRIRNIDGKRIAAKGTYHFERNVFLWDVENPEYIINPNELFVDDWTNEDWFYYWFVNARNTRPDGSVYTRWRPKKNFGPDAQRYHARRSYGYCGKAKAYQEHGSKLTVGKAFGTPYGHAWTEDPNRSLEESCWEGNVGVPYAYARTNDYDSWLELNLTAQRRALGRSASNVVPVAATYGYSGLEFLKEEDRNAEWLRWAHVEYVPTMEDIGVPPVRRSTLQRFVACHQTGLGWLFVLVVYQLSVALASWGCESGAFGLSSAVVVEVVAASMAIIFRKRLVKSLIGE